MFAWAGEGPQDSYVVSALVPEENGVIQIGVYKPGTADTTKIDITAYEPVLNSRSRGVKTRKRVSVQTGGASTSHIGAFCKRSTSCTPYIPQNFQIPSYTG